MLKPKPLLLICGLSLAASLSGCATSQVQPGAVVEAPQVQQPEAPALVKQTEPKPSGYFQKAILSALQQ